MNMYSVTCIHGKQLENVLSSIYQSELFIREALYKQGSPWTYRFLDFRFFKKLSASKSTLKEY